jgi:hypothetical protein
MCRKKSLWYFIHDITSLSPSHASFQHHKPADQQTEHVLRIILVHQEKALPQHSESGIPNRNQQHLHFTTAESTKYILAVDACTSVSHLNLHHVNQSGIQKRERETSKGNVLFFYAAQSPVDPIALPLTLVGQSERSRCCLGIAT